MRLVPSSQQEGSNSTSLKQTSNELGLHDALRHGQRSLATEFNSTNPLQNRLQKWEETQDNLKLNLQRNLYGMHLPVRQLMERKVVGMGRAPNSRPDIHMDILMGRDESLDVGDLFGGVEMDLPIDPHGERERAHRGKSS